MFLSVAMPLFTVSALQTANAGHRSLYAFEKEVLPHDAALSCDAVILLSAILNLMPVQRLMLALPAGDAVAREA